MQEARHERHILCDSIHVKGPEYVQPQRRKADSWLSGAGKNGQRGATI